MVVGDGPGFYVSRQLGGLMGGSVFLLADGVDGMAIEKAMMEGFSTASDKIREMGFGAGLGLPNIRRNSDELELHSEVGKGTTLQAVILLQSRRL